ncbi:MAG: hypothetical protein ACYDEP_02420 [Acidimicrobiales bacterium]
MKKSEEGAISNPDAYIGAIARRQAVSSIMGTCRCEVRQALAAFHARVEADVQRYKRELTAAEKWQIAEEIRKEQKPGRRAPEGFHLPVRQVGIEDALAIPDNGIPASSNGFDANSIAAKAERLLADGKPVAARHLAWNAVAERFGAPLVRPNRVTEKNAAKARRIVAEAGGVTAVADAALNRDVATEPAQAVLLPFGRLNQLSKKHVFDLLSTYPNVANQLWDATLTQATIKRKGRNGKRM